MNTKKLLTLFCALALTSFFFVSCSDLFEQDTDETDNIDKTLYSITYDANGAETGTAPAAVWNTETTVVTIAENTGKLARTGYAFAGWNTDKNGKGYAYAPASKMSMPRANITLYASWSALSYTVTWDSREADYPALPGKTTVSGPSMTVAEFPVDPSKSGLSFAGWWTEPDGKGERFTSDSVVSADITVYAKWTENVVHTVSFDSKGGSEVASLIIEDNHHAAEPKPPVKPGYAFGGWYADAGYSTPWDFVSMKIATNVTLTAKWDTYSYTISFDSADATVTAIPAAIKVTSPQTTVSQLPSVPEKTGYTFGGWYTKANGEGRQFKEDTAVSGDATVYAKWIPLRYTIKFDSVGADKTANPSSVMISYPQTSLNTLPLPPAKSGFLFGGWWTEKNGKGSEITKDTSFTKDATAYAYWKFLDRNVSFYHTYTKDSKILHATVTLKDPDVTIADMPGVPVKTGYDFGGWRTVVEGQGTEFTDKSEVFEDITVYAKWIKQPYTMAENQDGTVTLNAFTSSDADVVIPSAINGKTVTAIGAQAFSENTTMKTLVLPDTVTMIGEAAFVKCEALASVTLPDSLVTIGGGAFGLCLNLESIKIPNSVESIGEYAFLGCANMTSVTLPDTLTEIKKATFASCQKLVSIELPDTVSTIGDQAFSGCKNLVAIDLPPNLTSIGEEAFSLCFKLSAISIPDTITSISKRTFANCEALVTVELPDTLQSIGEEAFLGCISLPSIVIPESVTVIGQRQFWNCAELESVEIKGPITEIGFEFFNDCSKLKSFTVPSSVEEIGEDSFSGCASLESITIPTSVTKIAVGAFSQCTKLTMIALHDAVTAIGGGAFYGCNNLESIEIPSSVAEIGNIAFYGCDKLSEIIVNRAEPPILGTFAFWGLPSGYEIKVPAASLAAYQGASNWNDWHIVSK